MPGVTLCYDSPVGVVFAVILVLAYCWCGVCCDSGLGLLLGAVSAVILVLVLCISYCVSYSIIICTSNNINAYQTKIVTCFLFLIFTYDVAVY